MKICSSEKLSCNSLSLFNVTGFFFFFCIWTHGDVMRMYNNYLPYILQVLTVALTTETLAGL